MYKRTGGRPTKNVGGKKKQVARYFDNSVDESKLQKIRLKPERQQKFEGEIIQVNTTKLKTAHKKPGQFNRAHKSVHSKRPKIPKELLDKYMRGEKVQTTGVKTEFFKQKQQRKEIYLEYATEQAARTEILLQETAGFIEPDEDEITATYTQDEIAKNVDISAAAKRFNLNLDFGPYSMKYTNNGRHLLIGGRRGHVAAFDWITKKLVCEMNVNEEVVDVSWLHVNTMFACAQKKWVNIYDHQGTELHCIKRLYCVNRMEFLPYHFLLATGNREGYLSWLDVSIGELVGNYNTKMGDIRLLCQNPGNGVMCLGGGKGVVSMWSPKVKEPLAKLLCHTTPMSAITVDPKGMHMVTTGLDRLVKVWDVRALSGPLTQYHLHIPANHVRVSQRGVLAFGQGNHLAMYTNALLGSQAKTPYLQQKFHTAISDMHFCPYEDVLGVTNSKGFSSLLVPGSGEPNFDAYEYNPYQTKTQRREHEIHTLLEKIPAELIALDPTEIGGVDMPTLQEKIDAKRELFHVKPPQIELNTRRKMKGRGGTAKAARSKQIVKDQRRKEFIQEIRSVKQKVIESHKLQADDDFIPLEEKAKPSVLDRFRPKIRNRKT